VGTVFEWSMPGWVLVLVATAVYESLRHRRHHRDSMSMMREEDAQGAPPSHGVDLDRGVAYVTRPDDSIAR
jgi:hypothetical protein